LGLSVAAGEGMKVENLDWFDGPMRDEGGGPVVPAGTPPYRRLPVSDVQWFQLMEGPWCLGALGKICLLRADDLVDFKWGGG
jgi:hypothetical protein